MFSMVMNVSVFNELKSLTIDAISEIGLALIEFTLGIYVLLFFCVDPVLHAASHESVL
jgi:hypothetical protein